MHALAGVHEQPRLTRVSRLTERRGIIGEAVCGHEDGEGVAGAGAHRLPDESRGVRGRHQPEAAIRQAASGLARRTNGVVSLI